MLLVRHGESDWNAGGLIQGHSDVPTLTERGRAQASSAATMLREFDVARIVSSDQRRAHETALIVSEVLGVEVTTSSDLRERSFSSLEGQPQQAMDPADIGLVDGRIADVDRAVAGGESLSDVYRRVALWADRNLASTPAGDVVVVAHGGSIRMLRTYLDGLPLLGLPWGEISNGAVMVVTPGRPLLSATPH